MGSQMQSATIKVYAKKYEKSGLFAVGITNWLVYTTTFSPARTYYIQLNKSINLDRGEYYFDIVHGEIEMVDTLSQIYKVSLYESPGGKTKFAGYEIKEVSNGDKIDRIYLYKWENNLDRIELISLSFDEIEKREYYKLDTILVYKIVVP